MLATVLLLSLAQAVPQGGLKPRNLQPGDFQGWIDRALPGSILRVPAGLWRPIVIDKPLTLIGDDGAGFHEEMPYSGDPFPPIITLAGRGTGKVTLVNLGIGGRVDGEVYSSVAGAIVGGGFETLELFQCYVEAPTYWRVHLTCAGGPGISVGVGNILVVQSTVFASWGRDDFCGHAPGAAGIDASGSSVEIYGSWVAGSAFLDPCYRNYSPDPNFCPDPAIMAQAAGPGVRARCLEGDAYGSFTTWQSFTWTGPNYWDGTWTDCGSTNAAGFVKTGPCTSLSTRPGHRR